MEDDILIAVLKTVGRAEEDEAMEDETGRKSLRPSMGSERTGKGERRGEGGEVWKKVD